MWSSGLSSAPQAVFPVARRANAAAVGGRAGWIGSRYQCGLRWSRVRDRDRHWRDMQGIAWPLRVFRSQVPGFKCLAHNALTARVYRRNARCVKLWRQEFGRHCPAAGGQPAGSRESPPCFAVCGGVNVFRVQAGKRPEPETLKPEFAEGVSRQTRDSSLSRNLLIRLARAGSRRIKAALSA